MRSFLICCAAMAGSLASAEAVPAEDDEAETVLTVGERVSGLLRRWVEAQNRGDFAGYERLYHNEFSGVPRPGAGADRLDRARWMQDHRRLFQKRMVVSATRSHTTVSGADLRVSFTEFRESGGQRQLGRKRLVLVGRGDRLRIREEELLSVAPGRSEFDDLKRFAFVVGGRLVLHPAAPENWALGAGKIPASREDSINVVREANPRRLPAELKAWIGQRVRLFNAQGPVCQATVSRLQLVGRGDPPGEVQNDAEEVWRSSSHLLVAVPPSDQKACAGAVWARAASLPLPRVFPARPADARLQQAALRAFRALPEHGRLQTEYRKWQETPGEGKKKTSKRRVSHWDQLEPGNTRVLVIRRDTPALTLVSVSSRAGMADDDDCHDTFEGHLWGLWEVRQETGKLRLLLRNRPSDKVSLVPTAAVDIDGDGELEILVSAFYDLAQPSSSIGPLFYDTGIIRKTKDLYDDIEGLEVPTNIGPC
jgi:hypothetical protein